MKKIVIRADSSTQIGSGHLMRCLTLAKQLRKNENAEVFFISRNLEGNLNDLVTSEGFKLFTLPRHNFDATLTGYAAWLTVPQNVDAEETAKILKNLMTVDRLIVDSYAIDTQWETAMRPFVKEIFVIDDLANRKHNCDILLDQNFYINMESRYVGLVPAHCKLKLGPKNALLREEFYETKKNLRQRDGSIKNILVFYGGIDLTNETMKALQALSKLNLPNVTVNVVVGTNNANKNSIEEYCRENHFNFFCQVKNMAELMNKADISLGAGGTTTWERYFLELPSVVTAVAENQIKACEEFALAGNIIYLGACDTVGVEDICLVVKGLCDMNNFKNKNIVLKNFTENEIDETYYWVKNPIHRKRFIARAMATFEGNRNYWKNLLNTSAEKNKFFAVFVENLHIGNCGFKNIRDNKGELWIYLGYPFWNKGLGKKALALLLKNGFENLNFNEIFLHVAKFNTQASNMYKKAGFTVTENDDVFSEDINQNLYRLTLTKEEYQRRFCAND